MSVDNNVVLWPGWETVRLIGRGSFGAVYEIQRKLFEDDEEVEKAALKVISIPQNDSDIEEMYNDGYDKESVSSSFRSHLKSIVAEYSLMRKMNGSANIVNCDDVRYEQHADGIGWDIYIKMELLTPLAKSLPATVSDTQVIAIAKDMCEALELCDKHNIVHRDIKPQNIFVSPNGDYKLGDFGIAKTVEKTMGGTKTGTYKYMAPEVYNNKPYNSTADIYSLGLVLYWLLNERRMPFMPLPPAKLSAGMDEESRQRRFSGEAIPAPKNGSAALKKIVLKACAFDPKDRYQSAKEMREDLQRLSETAVSTPVAKPKQNSLADQETELPEEATVGPVFSRNAPPIVEDQEKTVGPVFGRQTVAAEEELEKTVGPQFALKKEDKPDTAKSRRNSKMIDALLHCNFIVYGLSALAYHSYHRVFVLIICVLGIIAVTIRSMKYENHNDLPTVIILTIAWRMMEGYFVDKLEIAIWVLYVMTLGALAFRGKRINDRDNRHASRTWKGEKWKFVLCVAMILVICASSLLNSTELHVYRIITGNLMLMNQYPDCIPVVKAINSFLASSVDLQTNSNNIYELKSGMKISPKCEYASLENACVLILPIIMLMISLIAIFIILIVLVFRRDNAELWMHKKVYRTVNWAIALMIGYFVTVDILFDTYIYFYHWIGA